LRGVQQRVVGDGFGQRSANGSGETCLVRGIDAAGWASGFVKSIVERATHPVNGRARPYGLPCTRLKVSGVCASEAKGGAGGKHQVGVVAHGVVNVLLCGVRATTFIPVCTEKEFPYNSP
jgi:hypothetical protein